VYFIESFKLNGLKQKSAFPTENS